LSTSSTTPAAPTLRSPHGRRRCGCSRLTINNGHTPQARTS
jgi:hypothetical protein